tara:strand:- start:409 stop:690 length:282 start_codon:yes stop_codon:yes gene_type:complete
MRRLKGFLIFILFFWISFFIYFLSFEALQGEYSFSQNNKIKILISEKEKELEQIKQENDELKNKILELKKEVNSENNQGKTNEKKEDNEKKPQ